MASWLPLLLLNFLQLLVLLIWLGGLQRFSGPLPPGLRAGWLASSLVLPPLLGILKWLGAPLFPEEFRLIRLEAWSGLILSSDSSVRFAFVALFFGTALIFLVQELIPVWRGRIPAMFELRRRNERLDRALDKIRAEFQQRTPLGFPSGRPLRIFLLETEESLAVLHGIVEPVILISNGLLKQLDEPELEAVIAHEYAHYCYGGNLRLLWIWIVRSLQAFNPAALIIFRSLTEIRELACDDLAVFVTQRPATLASAILKTYHPGELTEAQKQGVLNRTRNEILRHAESVTTRIRVRTLLDEAAGEQPPRIIFWLGTLVMGGILWAIG